MSDTYDEDYSDEPRDGRGRLSGDEKLHVKFYTQGVESTLESAEKGRRITKDETFILIRIPGDQHMNIDTFATEAYIKRFPNEYKAFIAKKEDDLIGTPVESLRGITPSVVSELRTLQVRTVEDLADLSDNVTIMGLQEWKRKAAIFLEKNSVAAAQKKEADLMARIAELEARVNAPVAKAKKGSDSEE